MSTPERSRAMASGSATPQMSPESLSSYRASLRRKMQEGFQDALERLEDATDDVSTRQKARRAQQLAEQNPLDEWGRMTLVVKQDRLAVEEAEDSPLKTGTSEASFTGLGSFPFTPPMIKRGESTESGASSSSGAQVRVASGSTAPKSQVEDVSVELARGVQIMRAERRPVVRLRRKSTEASVVFGRVDELGAELAKLLEDATRPGRMVSCFDRLEMVIN